MAESAPAPDADDTKPCKVCGEPIKKVARVCVHCNNYQDWRANVTVSTSVLSLLVALVTVLTAAVPVFVEAITPKNSKLIFTLQGIDEHSIGLLATNSGVRPGSVETRALFWISTLDSHFSMSLNLSLRENATAHVIEPGKSSLLQLSYDYKKDDYQIADADLNSNCSMLLYHTDFLGKKDRWDSTDSTCEEFREFLNGVRDLFRQKQKS